MAYRYRSRKVRFTRQDRVDQNRFKIKLAQVYKSKINMLLKIFIRISCHWIT